MDKNEILRILETAKDENGEVPMRLVRQAFEELPESCEDCVSRKDVLSEFCMHCDNEWNCSVEKCYKAEWIRNLPPVTQKSSAKSSELETKLEKIECNDCVSRQAVKDTVAVMYQRCDTHNMKDYRNLMLEAVNVLPSAQTDPYLDSIVREIENTISETRERGKHHDINVRANGEMICFGLQLALEIIEEKRNGRSDIQTGGD